MTNVLYAFIFSFMIGNSGFAKSSNVSDPDPISEGVIEKKLQYIRENKKFIDIAKRESLLLDLKKESEKINYEQGTLKSLEYLMDLYYEGDNNTDIVNIFDKTESIIRNKNDDPTGIISSVYRKNALALMYLGLDDASKKNVDRSIFLAKTIKNPDTKYLRLSQCYLDLHSHYNSRAQQSQRKRDKYLTLYYAKRALEEAKKISDDNGVVTDTEKYIEVIGAYIRLGIFYLEHSDEKGNLELAEKSLSEAESLQKTTNALSIRNQTTLLNQVSWLYMEKKDYNKSIEYAYRSLKLEKQSRRPSSRVESFEFLTTCYTQLGNKEKSKIYMQKYSVLKDSINIANTLNADNAMKGMVAEVKKEEKEITVKQWIMASIGILLMVICTLIFWIREKKLIKRKYDHIISKLKDQSFNETTETINEMQTREKNTISSETEKNLLTKLSDFENEQLFLKNDVNLTSLASSFNTNTKYLTDIIKKYRSKNFNDYINSLRINYIVYKLYNEPRYRDYKISYLAEISGFISYQVFILAFKKVIGMTPSYFIQSLKEDSNVNMPE